MGFATLNPSYGSLAHGPAPPPHKAVGWVERSETHRRGLLYSEEGTRHRKIARGEKRWVSLRSTHPTVPWRTGRLPPRIRPQDGLSAAKPINAGYCILKRERVIER